MATNLTAIIKAEQIPLPPELFQKLPFALGTRLLLTPASPGRIDVTAVAAGEKPGQSVVFNNREHFPLPKDAAAKAGIAAGDVVTLAVDAGAVRIQKLDDPKASTFGNGGYDADGIALPPSWLIQAFTGRPSLQAFVNSGKSGAQSIASLVKSAGQDIAEFGAILDFGCGCGRVLRALPRMTKASLHGIDLHEDAIEWCKTYLPYGEFHVGSEFPPIGLGDGTIDLLYAISVLTHLDEPHQDLWLEEWRRVVRPGGLVIATFRGKEFVDQHINSAPYVQAIENGWKDNNGFTFVSHKQWAGVFPGYYSDAYHTTDYVNSHWGKYFEVLQTLPSGAVGNRQEAALLRRRA